MRRVLVVTWALGTASGVLLGLFGVQLVSSRFSTTHVSPLSHPEVLRALQAARHVPNGPDGQVALPAPAAVDPPAAPSSPPTDAAPARPSAGATPSPADASPASTLPRPGSTAGTLADPKAAAAAAEPATTSSAPALADPPSSTTTSTAKDDSKAKSKSDGKKNTSSGSTTTSSGRKTTTTTGGSAQSSRQTSSPTISCPGGVVTVRYSGGKVELKAARPNSGYEVYVAPQRSDGEVVVYFLNDKDNTAYQVQAFYTNGSPDYRVTKYQWSSRKGQSQVG